ncbi:MAG: type I glyceraldehyde-3-phosphate dehydrogenase [bacterium]
MKIAINGFGRIGRQFLRIALERDKQKDIIAVNDLTSADNLAYLLKYDTSYGVLQNNISGEELQERDFKGRIHIDDYEIKVLAEPDPSKLPWKELGVDIVIESTGLFTKIEDAEKHIEAGAKKVIITAPSKSEDVKTVVLGVNQESIEKNDQIISMASCTTNSLAPVMAVLDKSFGVEKAIMSTIHSYTADQNIQDGPHKKDYRRGRAAAQNIVPTTTGAAKATCKTIPNLSGKFDGIAVRVPALLGSLSDITSVLKKSVTQDEVNQAFLDAEKQDQYKGILVTSSDPIVSSDIIQNPASTIIDLEYTRVVGENLVKVIAWYDNEWGYSNRLMDLCEEII